MANSDHESAPVTGPIDKQFNRQWDGTRHIYLDNQEQDGDLSSTYEGLVKCKLVHGIGRSLIVPELVFLGNPLTKWIQPLFFIANILMQLDETSVVCDLRMEISCGKNLRLRLFNTDRVHRYKDGSELYKCTIFGPPSLEDYATGDASPDECGLPVILLYHHTSEDSRSMIIKSGHFYGSKWNIQGTKQFQGIEFVYFTCLPKLDCETCLKRVGMASDGKICLRRDPTPPRQMALRYEQSESDNLVVELQVYRENTLNRTGSIEVWIDPGVLSPSHILERFDDHAIWYEVVSAFVYRVAIVPGSTARFLPTMVAGDNCRVIYPGYMVIGGAWTTQGLVAPFNEDVTSQILKIENPPPDITLLGFWFDRPNSDRYSDLSPARARFDEESN